MSGLASDLSRGSVAVLIHDLIQQAGHYESVAVDVASQIVERGDEWTGRFVVQLAQAGLGIREALLKGEYCNADVADELQLTLGALFAPDAHVAVTRAHPEERASDVAYELMQLDGERYTPERELEWKALLGRADRVLRAGPGEDQMMLGAVQDAAARLRAKLPGPRWIEDLVVRVLTRRVPKAELDEARDKYWEEVERAAELSDAGLAPRTYTRLVLWEPDREHVRLGVVLERFEFSLDEVQMCPSLTRRMFVESDGEGALVDLYSRTGGRMRCVDTKPGNVVVRLPRGLHELGREEGETRVQYRERVERMRPRLALIDVDPHFCGKPSKYQEARPAGASTVADLDAALGAHTPGTEIANYGIPPLYVAAMSLLVHCTVAAAMGSPYGYPYVRIGDVLISRWAKVEALVIQDRHEGMMVPDGARVHSQLKHYTQDTPEAVRRRAHPDAPDTREMGEVLEDARHVIGRRLGAAATNVLRLCIGPPLADPVLYEYTALILGQTKCLTALITGPTCPAGVYKRVTELAKRATDLPQLQQWMQAIEKELRAGLGWRPECRRVRCEAHYNYNNADDTQMRGLSLPIMLDRPLLAQRRVETPVHERAERAPRHRNDVPLDELDVHGVAALLHETVRGRFGEAIADNVARAVERTLTHRALDGATLWARAQNGELTTTLRRMHIEDSVARHIDHEIGRMDPSAVPRRATDVVELDFGYA
jgi:hypothetical protein